MTTTERPAATIELYEAFAVDHYSSEKYVSLGHFAGWDQANDAIYAYYEDKGKMSGLPNDFGGYILKHGEASLSRIPTEGVHISEDGKEKIIKQTWAKG